MKGTMVRQVVRGVVGMSVAVLLVFCFSVPALAFDFRGADTVTVADGEVIEDDLYVGANIIIIEGTVDGDVWAAANTIAVGGIVSGSTMAAGRMVAIQGDIGHAVRAVGETVSVSGNVDGDLMAGCARLDTARSARIGGDLLLGAGNARIDGLVEGDIRGGGGSVSIGGVVQGDIELEVETLTIESTADIQGNLVYTSENEAAIQSGAKVAGVTTHKLPEKERDGAESSAFAFLSDLKWKFIGFLMSLLAGLVLILLAPKWLSSVSEAVRSRPGPSAGWGALVLFVTPIAAIVTCITIIGIPLGLIALALWGIAIYLAQIPVGLFVGKLIIGRYREVEGKGIMVAALALGLVILKLLRLIPYLGFWIGVAAVIFGLGAVVVSERRRRVETLADG